MAAGSVSHADKTSGGIVKDSLICMFPKLTAILTLVVFVGKASMCLGEFNCMRCAGVVVG